MKNTVKNRRNVLKLALAGVVAGKTVLKTAVAQAAAKIVNGMDAKTPDPKAKNFNYYADVANVPDKLVEPKKALAKGRPINCSTCILYKEHSKEGYGLCPPLFQQNLINDKGYCTTWNPKPQ